jgi:hypothetical protein
MNNNNGLCECGCGQPAPIATHTNTKHNQIKGQPCRFISGHNGILNHKPLIERFWEKVNKQGPMPDARSVQVHPEIAGTRCWEWTARVNNKGRGSFHHDGKDQLAPRVSFFLETGRYPVPCACHKCDNPTCVRFSHLFEGTHADNLHDASIKNRFPDRKGERNSRALLSANDVKVIKGFLKGQTATIKEIATQYQVGSHVIYAIAAGDTWTHIT